MATESTQEEMADAAFAREPIRAPEAAREPVRPPEASHGHEHTPALPGQSQSRAAEPEKTQEKLAEKGNWFHRNRWFTKEPISYAGYQFFRSAMATIPYGFGMAFMHHAFGLASKAGVRMGLTEKGQSSFYEAMKKVGPNGLPGGAPAGFNAINVFEKEAVAALHTPGIRGSVGRNLARLANSPLNAAMQIGLSFGMFRFVGTMIKGLRDKVTDENNTAEDTNRETKNWWQTIKEMGGKHWKAEAIGTFWAGLTLGFIGALVQQTMPYKRLANETTWNAIKRVVSKPSKLLQNAGIWAISYSTFFEIDERIQKDVKLRHGDWKGNSNSLLNKPDELVGVPPKKAADGSPAAAESQPEKTKFSSFTHDPSLPRLWFRRVLPVAVGITGYAVMKRSAYVIGGGQMKAVTDEVKTLGQHAKLFGGNAWREGLATATFGILWMATDAWGTWYDKFFHSLQNKENQTPATPHQQQKYADLLERVNAKEHSAGRAA